MHRSGVALIIAISVLAALLFLALPFLFSQSASIAGARAASMDGVSRRGADRAANLATAMSVYATGLHRSPALALQLGTAQLTYVQLPQQISDTGSAGAIRFPGWIDSSWRLTLEPGTDWSTASGTVTGVDSSAALHGAIIEDETRRVDPNDLDERGWAVVLRRAGIKDPWTVELVWNGTHAGRQWVPSIPRYSWRMETYGRLARRLTHWRPGNGTAIRRFNRLEDLLGADPDEAASPAPRTHGCIPFYRVSGWPLPGQHGWPVDETTVEGTRNAAEVDPTIKDPASTGDTTNLGWRVAALTQAELERLRPLLSFLVPGQGRSGLVDYGTVVATGKWEDGWWDSTIDALSPSAQGVGQALIGGNTWVHSATGSSRNWGSSGWGTVGEALAINAVPCMNINTIPSSSGMTRLYLGQPVAESDTTYQTRIETVSADPRGRWWRIDPVNDPIGTYADLPLLRWLDPRTGDGLNSFERPPMSIAGFGIVAIEGLAQARDAQGHPATARRRRMVVQAVPQERPVEAAWVKQGDFESLIRQRHGSWVMAGPHPTNRIADANTLTLGGIADWAADPATGRDAMAALDGPGWLQPAPVCSFTKNPVVNIDWAVPFGLTTAKPWADVLKDTVGSRVPSVVSGLDVTDLKATGTAAGALEADGLHIIPGRELAWDLSDDHAPLTASTSQDELTARHLSLRFALHSVGDSVLLEARAQEFGVDIDDDGVPDQRTAEQNLWRVEYRHSPPNSRLVLVIANAALPWGDTERTRRGLGSFTTGSDATADAAYDARCRVGSLDFAPADAPNARTVEFHYAVPGAGLQAGRWHHLQVFCASDRPDTHGLILDGVVGRDATRGGVDMNTLGDHYTAPALRLSTAIAGASKLLGGALATPSTIAVTFPQTLALTDLLPSRGLVRIDDEYFSYTGLSGGSVGTGSGTLTGVQRARRIVTDQNESEDLNDNGILDKEDDDGDGVLDPGEDDDGDGILDTEDRDGDGVLDITSDYRRFPAGQAHAVGALVTPGWYQRDLGAATWLRGAVTLAEDFPAERIEGRLSGWQDSNGDGNYDRTDGSTATLTVTAGVWPDHGYVQIGASRRAYFTGGTSGTLQLTWSGVGVDNTGGVIGATTTLDCHLASIRVTGEISDSGPIRRFVAGGGALQLLGSTNNCEWIRYELAADRGANDRHFVREDGWDMTAFVINPVPAVQPRGAMRTPFGPDPLPAAAATNIWRAGTTVLPVQTLIGNARGLESGDVATLVPGSAETDFRHPVQVVVRHAARDGYPATELLSGDRHETFESWFALAHAVPPPTGSGVTGLAFESTRQLLLVGRGWCGDDLSVAQNSRQRRGAMPRKLLLSAADGTPVARCYVGGPDPVDSTSPAGRVILDDLCAGDLSGGEDVNVASTASGPGGSEIVSIGGSTSGSIASGASALPVTVTANRGVFAQRNSPLYGICLIGGEAFAYRMTSAEQAVLIARALLGTTAQTHTLAGGTVAVAQGITTRSISPTLPVVVLPIGPVAELCSDLPANGYAAGATVGLDVVEVPFANYYKDPVLFDDPGKTSNADDPNRIMDPPFVAIHHPSNGTAEVTRLLRQPQSHQRTVALWLRGLYGTTALAWTAPYTPASHATTWDDAPPPATPVAQGAGRLNPVVIGYWPRFAPPLPSTPSTPHPESLRSRSFAWAGFPLRLSGSRFDPTIPALASAGVLDVLLQDDGGCLSTDALGLAAEETTSNVFDWENAWPSRQSLAVGGTVQTTSTPFNWGRFVKHEVDGAEARILWTANPVGTGLVAAAGEAGRAPRISTVRLRCVAPTRVLAVEEVR